MKTKRMRTRLCLEQLEDRLLPSSTPPLTMTFATTPDSRTITVNYDISGASLAGKDLSFSAYRSAEYNSLKGAQLLGKATIPGSDNADLSEGSHSGVTLSLTAPDGKPVTALTPNTALPFVVVVANLDGSQASFETHVLGVIAHGLTFDPSSILQQKVPDWETQMAADLQQHDGYEAVIAFNWVLLSVLPSPLAIQLAGQQLHQQVVAEADQLASQHPGDVVDINFIGHSRGAVVVSEVLQDLVGTSDPALRGGYMEMTLLDPHPANLSVSQFSWQALLSNPSNQDTTQFSWAALLSVADEVAVAEVVFKLLAQDPQVVIPSNVNQIVECDQQTPTDQLAFLTNDLVELVLNLWGESPSALTNDSGQAIVEKNLTNVNAPGIGLIGHLEVPLWYLNNVVDKNETFTL